MNTKSNAVHPTVGYRTLVPLLLLAACTPQNAELTEGSYAAFIAEGSSLSLQKGEVDPQDYPQTWNVDCREFENQADEAALRLEDPLKICGQNNWPPEYEAWAVQSGYRVVTEPIEPWRGEALITAEGDMQVAFHHRLPGGADFRFVFAIDPDFGPVACRVDDEGNTLRQPMDGDWIKNWSGELDYLHGLADQLNEQEAGRGDHLLEAYSHLEPYRDNGRLYLLNARGYQFNPADPTGPDWDFPEIWASGAAQGKFSEENLFHRTARFGEPEIYNAVEASEATETAYVTIRAEDLWYCDMEPGTDPTTNPCMTTTRERLDEITVGVQDELDRMLQPDKETPPLFTWAPIGHTNFWREPDGLPPGFDGWSELHYNYVVFSGDSQLEVGGSAEGAFSLTFDADESSTRIFVKGRFVIDRIKKDKWTTADLRQEKLLENGVELCSAASDEDAAPSEK